MKEMIEEILNRFPEVTWDRWCGSVEESKVVIFGWISREDGKSDFLILFIDEEGVCIINTSSAKYSEEFCKRVGFNYHKPCKQVAGSFDGVKAIWRQ